MTASSTPVECHMPTQLALLALHERAHGIAPSVTRALHFRELTKSLQPLNLRWILSIIFRNPFISEEDFDLPVIRLATK